MRITARNVFTTQTITATVPLFRSSSTSTTVIELSKPAPTTPPAHHHKSGLSPSSIGAIVGSILGALVLLVLIYFCCFRQSNDEDYYSDDQLSDSPRPRKPPSPSPPPRLPEKVEKRGEDYRWVRPARRKHRGHMNQPRAFTRSRGRRQTQILYEEDSELGFR